MGVAWKLRKAVRKIRLPCGSFSRTHADYDDPVSDKNISNSTVVSANQEIVSALMEQETQSSGAIKSLCAICLEPLSYSTGGGSPGQAIFTAQCSHAFHFTCISSNVRHGSVTCPICRAHWSQLPRTLYTHSSSSSCQQLLPNTCNNNQIQTDDPILRILDESIATFRVHRRSSLRSARYDDDDPVEPDHTTPNHPRLHLTLVPCNGPLGHHGHPNFPPPCAHPSLQAMGGPTTSYHHHSCELSTPPHHHFTTSSYPVSPENTSPATTRNSPYHHHHHHHHLCFPNTSGRAYLSVKLAHQQATDIVLVASPNGPHLRLLKQSMALVVFSLRSVDRLAIVTYSSAATRAFPLRRMTSHGKRTALQVIDRLFYMGEADPAAGLKKGIKILEDRIHKNPESCILHLSDSPTRSYVDHEMGVPVPIHRFHVGFGFGTSYGFVMHEFEEFLTRLLGGVIRDTQLMIGEDGGIARLGELRGGEERRIQLELGESGYIRVGYSYIEGGVEEYIRTGEIVVSIGEKMEVGEGGDGGRRDMSVIAARPSNAESWNYHDSYMNRRWAKHLHGQRL